MSFKKVDTAPLFDVYNCKFLSVLVPYDNPTRSVEVGDIDSGSIEYSERSLLKMPLSP